MTTRWILETAASETSHQLLEALDVWVQVLWGDIYSFILGLKREGNSNISAVCNGRTRHSIKMAAYSAKTINTGFGNVPRNGGVN